MAKYLKKNRKLDQKKMISARIRTHVIEAFQNASDEANKNGYSLSLASVIEEALEYSIAEYTEVSGRDFLQIEKDKLEDEWEKLQTENNQLKDENKSLIDQIGNERAKRYHESGAYDSDMFLNSLEDSIRIIKDAIYSLNSDVSFSNLTVKKIQESYISENSDQDAFHSDPFGSIASLIKWSDSSANNPSKAEIINAANKIQAHKRQALNNSIKKLKLQSD